jgi:glycosyltransferase involved in cell wall biosynthesis
VHILANTADLSPNTGISVQTLQVTEELARRGHGIDLVYIQDGDYRSRYASFCSSMQRVPALDLGVRHAARDALRLVPSVRAGVRTHPDVVYLNRFRPLPWALATGALARAPVVCHLHGLIGIEKPAVNRALGRVTAQYICVSRYVRDRFVELGGDPRRTVVVHNGIDVADYPAGGDVERQAARVDLELAPDPLVVMFYGRVVPEKGLHVLVQALARLNGRDRPVELLVVGPQPDPDYARDTFRIAPDLPIRQMPMTMDVVTPLHAADVVSVPSVWDEPFGRTVIEALSTGRPVVASAVGGIPEILDGDLARFLVPADDVEALTATLDETLGWREHEPGLGEACTAHVAGSFSKRAMVDAVEDRLAGALG